MKRFDQLDGSSRRQHLRLLRYWHKRWQSPLGVFVRGSTMFRMTERLHRAGFCVAAISKYGWLIGKPFRELQVFSIYAEAVSDGKPILIGAIKCM